MTNMAKTEDEERIRRVVIVGGGFGGLKAAQRLRKANVDVTLVDRRNFHLFQPLLYQVATGGLSPANIASPLRGILRNQKNLRVRKAEVRDFDLARQRVILENDTIDFDYLIVASGSKLSYFGNDEWKKFSVGLKTIEHAVEIRRRVLLAFEQAESETDPSKRRTLLNFVIIGGGPTGVELAGALSELANHTLKNNFRSIDTSEARVTLLEASNRLLHGYDSTSSDRAKSALEQLGVEIRLSAQVTDVTDRNVIWRERDETYDVDTCTVLWAAGVAASSLGRKLADQSSAPVDKMGRVEVLGDLSINGHPNVFVIGDLACISDADGNQLPGVAPVAMQQGTYVAELIMKQLGGRSCPPFHYRDFGQMAVIGRSAAVAEIGFARFHGLVAWLAWLFVHLIQLVEFQNRVLVLFQWAWNYLTRNRSARLITGEDHIEQKLAAREAAGVELD